MYFVFFFVKQKTAYDMRISDWSSDVCSSDLRHVEVEVTRPDPGPLVIDIGPSTGTLTGTGIDSVALDPPPPPLPPLIAAQADPRYAAALQPAYPSAERRANREGNVVIKVLIGTDGRVKRVERVSATSDAFFEATRRQALGHWRFKPATRGGVPPEKIGRASGRERVCPYV